MDQRSRDKEEDDDDIDEDEDVAGSGTKQPNQINKKKTSPKNSDEIGNVHSGKQVQICVCMCVYI